MASCGGIKADGGRCKAQAISNSQYCFSHSPEHAEARKQRGRKGGRRGGRGRSGADLSEIKRDVRQLIDDVLNGSVDRGRAAVAIQGFNALRGMLELERKIREQDEIVARLEALEAATKGQGGRSRTWGR